MNERRKWTVVLITITVFVTTAAFLPGLVRAGDLEPSAPPGSTMHTLDEIYNKLEQLAPGGSAPVAKTGQTTDLEPSAPPGSTMHTLDEIYNKLEQLAPGGGPAPVAKTGQINKYADGDDGDPLMQKGVAWPDPRFTDHGDGTVTDNLTGLMWTKNADIYGMRTWADTLSDCASCSEGVYSDWRLPNVRELHSLIDCGRDDPPLPAGHPFSNVQPSYYWSSTTLASSTSYAWGVGLYSGGVGNFYKGYTYYVWCVRGGQ